MKPIIGVVPLVDEAKNSLWMLPGYMEGVEKAGGVPVMLPLTSEEETIDILLRTIQGILLTGGHDVDPSTYGEDKIPQCGATCRERDKMEHILLGRALGRDIPVLGICRGIQFINVFLGGSLYQDLPTQRSSCTEHHQKPPYDVPVHEVELMDNSGRFRLLNRKSLSVNSYHHQAIKEKATALKIMAAADDGIIEAVELPDKKFVWGLQWHPEFSYKSNDNSRLIFKEFVRKCSE